MYLNIFYQKVKNLFWKETFTFQHMFQLEAQGSLPSLIICLYFLYNVILLTCFFRFFRWRCLLNLSSWSVLELPSFNWMAINFLFSDFFLFFLLFLRANFSNCIDSWGGQRVTLRIWHSSHRIANSCFSLQPERFGDLWVERTQPLKASFEDISGKWGCRWTNRELWKREFFLKILKISTFSFKQLKYKQKF